MQNFLFSLLLVSTAGVAWVKDFICIEECMGHAFDSKLYF